MLQTPFRFGISTPKSTLNKITSLTFSTSSKILQENSDWEQIIKNTNSNQTQLEWKKNVVVVPIATTIDDLKKSHKLVKDGFYVSHRIYVDKMPEKYTIEPILTKRTGGYDIETRERLYRRIGGGLPTYWHFIDFKRVGPSSGPPLVEKIIDIIKPRDRTAFIALVAHGDIKRYILATQNMKIGDLIRTSCEIPRIPVQAFEGDAYPLGALPIGTQVHSIEAMPREGGIFCRAAGSFATVKSVIDDRVIIQLPSDLEVSLDKTCMATVGQVSHASHKDEKLTHPVDTRDLGYRPRSGLWHRKDGQAGRKIKPPKPLKIMTNKVEEKVERMKYTYKNWSLTE